jgi:E3 ubiquitin-protein ligase KEG
LFLTINIIVFSNGCRFEVGDWVKFKRSITAPTYGWQGARHKSVGFVQSVPDKDNLIVSFCSGEARVLANEVIKVMPLDRGQHVQLKPDVKEPRFDPVLILSCVILSSEY